MAGRDFSPEEREFLKATGLDVNQLEPLMADAPGLPQDVLERIRVGARAKAGVVPEPEPAALPAARRRFRPWVAAAALLVVAGAVALSQSDGAMAAIHRLVRLVPGIGLTEADVGTLVMPSPVSVELDGQQLTITGLISSSDGTQLRYEIEGLSWEKQISDVSGFPFRAALRLADGTELDEFSSVGSAREGSMSGIIWFAAPPRPTEAFTLSITPVDSSVAPFEVTIPVVDAALAGLPEAVEGGWSRERMGIRVGVPFWTVQGDRIVLNLEVRAPEGIRIEEVGEVFKDHRLLPVLTDDRGRTYPLIEEESRLRKNSFEPVSLVFQGPVASDAGVLRLHVPVVRIADMGAQSARLVVPLSQLPIGDSLQLQKEIEVGSYRFTVTQVTRLDERAFRFDVDLGPERDGVLLQEVAVRPAQLGRGEGWSGSWIADPETAQMTNREIELEVIRSGRLDVEFSEPVVRLQGDWEVTIPLSTDIKAE